MKNRQISDLIYILLDTECIDIDDLRPAIQKGTAQMIGKNEEDIFNLKK